MPRTVSKGPKQIHADQLAEKLEPLKAKAANPKATDADKKAYAKAQEEYKTALAAANRERFVKYGNGRINSAVTSLRAMAKLSNRKSYEYTEADATKALDIIRKEMTALENAFKTALAGTPATGGSVPTAIFTE